MIDRGSFIRKKNWEFFKQFYRSGKPVFLPSVQVYTCGQNKPESITINGDSYPVESLIEITEAESICLNGEFADMKLSENLIGDISQHLRKDNNEPKVAQEYGYALRYCFTFNQKNPGTVMNAYRCKICGEIHCGTLLPVVEKPSIIYFNELAICGDKDHVYSKAMNQPSPRLCINCGKPEEIIPSPALTKKTCRHQYSKAMNQPSPRLCGLCGEPEKR